MVMPPNARNDEVGVAGGIFGRDLISKS